MNIDGPSTKEASSIERYVGLPGYYILALSDIGVVEVETPKEYLDRFQCWTESSLWFEGLSAYDAVVDEDQAAMIGSFIEAGISGYAACTARTKMGDSLILRFFAELERHNAIIVLFCRSEVEADSVVLERNEPLPLRMTYRTNLQGIFEEIDDACGKVLGWGPEMVGQPLMLWGHPDDHQTNLHFWSRVVADPYSSYRHRLRWRSASNEYRWFELTVQSRQPGEATLLTELIDITAHVTEAPSNLADADLLTAIAGLASVGIIVLDYTGKIVLANPLSLKLLGAQANIVASTKSEGQIAKVVGQVLSAPDGERATARVAIATPNGIVMATATAIQGSLNRKYALVTAELDKSSLPRDIPKGLSASTLTSVIDRLANATERATFKSLATEIGVSEVTARRYLTFLVESGRAEVRHEYHGRGRPVHTYSLRQ